MSTPTKPTAPKPTPPVPAPTPTRGPSVPQPPVPTQVSAGKKLPPPPGAEGGSPAPVEVPPELTGEPGRISPAGIILNPDVPAPIPPKFKEGDTLPMEAQPAIQGSLTPGQVAKINEDRAIAAARIERRNPAIRATSLTPLPETPEVSGKLNEDGFVGGTEVSDAQLMAFRNRGGNIGQPTADDLPKK